jgi:L-methionine (R)-S-oxide reductase
MPKPAAATSARRLGNAIGTGASRNPKSVAFASPVRRLGACIGSGYTNAALACCAVVRAVHVIAAASYLSGARPSLSGSKTEQYQDLAQQAKALVDGEHDRIANAANLSSLVYHSLPDLNWVGFYFFDGTEVVAGPFHGHPARVRISLDRRGCGGAARSGQTQRVDDVHAVADHIACGANTNSELVVPLIRDGNLIGVFDLGGHGRPARFRDPQRLTRMIFDVRSRRGATSAGFNAGR